MKVTIFTFDVNGDEKGSLVALEENNNIPFDIKRVYYIFDTKKGVRRGFHAHRELKQILICISGSCKIYLFDGEQKQIITLNNPSKGLYVDSMIWREMYDFSPGCVLMVLANEYYYEKDYIRNEKEFLRLINSKE